MPTSYTSGDDTVISFNVHITDEPFIKALRKFMADGPRIVQDSLREVVIQQLPETQDWLRQLAGPLGNVTAPAWGPFGASDHAFVKIAKSLTFTERGGRGTVRIYSGPDYKIGVKGSRMSSKYGNISLAKVHVGGAKDYPYNEGENGLPLQVRSSVGWSSGTGKSGDSSLFMVLKGTHPGFPNPNTPQADYTTHAEGGVTDKWPAKMNQKITDYARRYFGGGI